MSGAWTTEALVLRRGGLVIYPTETLYALGCLATLPRAVERIFVLKGRPLDKPLPLIIADWDMAARFVRLNAAALALAREFWPGPLSIVTEVDQRISPLARDKHGRGAVRMTPHPIAQALCREAGAPLVSSSANKSGQPAVADPRNLDADLAAQALVIDVQPWPGGGPPSTLVEVAAAGVVRILRPGVLGRADFAAHGYDVKV